MSEEQQPEIDFEHDDFDFTSLEDELQVDERCQSLLKQFYQHLQRGGRTPQQASELAYAVDFYLRDYVIDFCRYNVVRPQPGVIRRFAANWYITHTLDPEIALLERHLEGIREFYRYLHGQHYICREELTWLENEATQSEYYQQRIESFLAIYGDGYVAWEAECPLTGGSLKEKD
ncbi:MAG: hypothetical protein M0T70_09685 [Geobacteraceae bacterium]|nr:hypothetical protein [Geobacteraceae bacterium]